MDSRRKLRVKVAHTLRGEGMDASGTAWTRDVRPVVGSHAARATASTRARMGTGRGTPLVHGGLRMRTTRRPDRWRSGLGPDVARDAARPAAMPTQAAQVAGVFREPRCAKRARRSDLNCAAAQGAVRRDWAGRRRSAWPHGCGERDLPRRVRARLDPDDERDPGSARHAGRIRRR